MLFFVYIIRSLKDNEFYIGQTNNIAERLLRHNNGKVAATRNRKPFILIYEEKYPSRSEAMKREKYLKSLKGGLEKKLGINFER